MMKTTRRIGSTLNRRAKIRLNTDDIGTTCSELFVFDKKRVTKFDSTENTVNQLKLHNTNSTKRNAEKHNSNLNKIPYIWATGLQFDNS